MSNVDWELHTSLHKGGSGGDWNLHFGITIHGTAQANPETGIPQMPKTTYHVHCKEVKPGVVVAFNVVSKSVKFLS